MINDIHLEKGLLPEKIAKQLTNPIYSNVICVINPDADPGKIKMDRLMKFMTQRNITIQMDYSNILRIILSITSSPSKGRFCRWVSGFENKSFHTDNFILISYLNHDSKNYINGFIQVKDCDEYPNIIKTNYICTDLLFSGIGKNLLILLKIIVRILEIKQLRIESINRASTQNFYTSQGFYPLEEQVNANYTWFEWEYQTRREKDQEYMMTFNIPFLIQYDSQKSLENRDMIDKTKIIPFLSRRHTRRYSPQSTDNNTPPELEDIFREVLTPRKKKSSSPRQTRKSR